MQLNCESLRGLLENERHYGDKEPQQQLRVKAVGEFKVDLGHKAIKQDLNIPQSTVRSIIWKRNILENCKPTTMGLSS